MTPEQAEHLARGYAWGHADASKGVPSGTAHGIAFGIAYREHVEKGGTYRASVQTAYESWHRSGQIKL